MNLLHLVTHGLQNLSWIYKDIFHSDSVSNARPFGSVRLLLGVIWLLSARTWRGLQQPAVDVVLLRTLYAVKSRFDEGLGDGIVQRTDGCMHGGWVNAVPSRHALKKLLCG